MRTIFSWKIKLLPVSVVHNFLWRDFRWLAQLPVATVSLENSEPLRTHLEFRNWDLCHLLRRAAGCSGWVCSSQGAPVPLWSFGRSLKNTIPFNLPCFLSPGSSSESLFGGGLLELERKACKAVHCGYCSQLVTFVFLVACPCSRVSPLKLQECCCSFHECVAHLAKVRRF